MFQDIQRSRQYININMSGTPITIRQIKTGFYTNKAFKLLDVIVNKCRHLKTIRQPYRALAFKSTIIREPSNEVKINIDTRYLSVNLYNFIYTRSDNMLLSAFGNMLRDYSFNYALEYESDIQNGLVSISDINERKKKYKAEYWKKSNSNLIDMYNVNIGDAKSNEELKLEIAYLRFMSDKMKGLNLKNFNEGLIEDIIGKENDPVQSEYIRECIALYKKETDNHENRTTKIKEKMYAEINHITEKITNKYDAIISAENDTHALNIKWLNDIVLDYTIPYD